MSNLTRNLLGVEVVHAITPHPHTRCTAAHTPAASCIECALTRSNRRGQRATRRADFRATYPYISDAS